MQLSEPTQDQVNAGVAAYFDANPPPAGPAGPAGPVGPAGPAPTNEQITSAVASYLASNPPPAGAKGDKGDKGDAGDAGPAGKDGADVIGGSFASPDFVEAGAALRDHLKSYDGATGAQAQQAALLLRFINALIPPTAEDTSAS